VTLEEFNFRECHRQNWHRRRIVLTRIRSHPETSAYVTNRRIDGLSTPEIMRCLKRYVPARFTNIYPT